MTDDTCRNPDEQHHLVQLHGDGEPGSLLALFSLKEATTVAAGPPLSVSRLGAHRCDRRRSIGDPDVETDLLA